MPASSATATFTEEGPADAPEDKKPKVGPCLNHIPYLNTVFYFFSLYFIFFLLFNLNPTPYLLVSNLGSKAQSESLLQWPPID